MEKDHVAEVTEATQLTSDCPLLAILAHSAIRKIILHVRFDDLTQTIAMFPGMQLQNNTAVTFSRFERQAPAVAAQQRRLEASREADGKRRKYLMKLIAQSQPELMRILLPTC